MSFRLVSWILLTLFNLTASYAPASAQVELIEAVGILEDETTTATLEDIATQRFTPSMRSENLGYSDSVFWIKLRIVPPAEGGSVMLLTNPQMIENIQLFAPNTLGSSHSEIQANGNSYETIDQSIGLTPRTYVLFPQTSGTDYFLRIASSGSISLKLSAQSPEDAMRTVNSAHFLQFIYLTFMTLLLAWALKTYIAHKEPKLLIFLPLLSLWIIHNLFSFGYLSVILPGVNGDILNMTFRCIVLSSSFVLFLFHKALLTPFQPSNLAKKLIDTQPIITASLIFIFIFVDKNTAIKANAYFLAISPVTFLIAAMTANRNAFIELNSIRIFYAIQSCINVFWVAQLIGIDIHASNSHSGALIYGIMTLTLIFLILAKYSMKLSRNLEADKARLEALRNKEVIESEKRKSLADFIDTLSHETKNALSVISMSVAAATIDTDRKTRILRAISGLNSVIDRCDQSIQADNIDQNLKMQTCSISNVLFDVANDQIERHRISIHKESEVTILADPVFLRIIFSNLLENALKYSPSDSIISVELNVIQGDAVIAFKNKKGGAGMPDPRKVFLRHYRGERAKSQAGSGLGLYICARLVHAQNGTLEYLPEENCIKFVVSFPCETSL
jgi:signal transduction histidine kinase